MLSVQFTEKCECKPGKDTEGLAKLPPQLEAGGEVHRDPKAGVEEVADTQRHQQLVELGLKLRGTHFILDKHYHVSTEFFQIVTQKEISNKQTFLGVFVVLVCLERLISK